MEPRVLPDTPSVLSIDRRCMREGYHFIWLSNKHPYMRTPSGKLVALAVEGDIPYHISGDPRCQPVEPTREMSIPCLLEHMKEVAGLDPQPAAPAEAADAGDEMMEAAIRELEADEMREMEADKKRSIPKVTGFPAGGQNADKSQDDKGEEAPPEDDLYTKKGAFQRELKEWGDVVTMDFVFPEDQMDDVMMMLTVKDVFTNFIGAHPLTLGRKSMSATP